ncbi:MAG: cyclic nucleotide-binding domain-containing protein [Desulfobacteraceae bacterium]|nr:cyclic nucleotide-binding domain-containing protein [Desulfobacteraceae bacterium]
MNVKCEKCQADFSIDDSLVKETGSNVRCSKCKTVFKVYPPGATDGQHPKMTKELLEFSKYLVSKKEKSFSDTLPVFKIIEDKDCPLYKLDDEFQLSDKIFLVPAGKAPCLILAKDVVKILTKIKSEELYDPDDEFKCTGCTGAIGFGYKKEDKPDVSEHEGKPGNYVDAVITLLISFSIFKNLTETEIKDIVSFLKLEKFDEDDIILRKGEPGRNLFIIVSGRVEVVSDDGMTIAFMGKGEVFGEMSLLSGDPVGATVKSVESSTLLYIGSKDFKRILNEIPSLQLNFTRLLARRMAEINLARSEEFASGMTGKLSEMPPAELFQTLNVNQKTGVLTLKLPKESAYLSFREGELVSARYREKEGENAFFELLKKREGRFKFIPGLSPEEMEASEIGDFMHLLMEGLRKIDEDDKAFLKTIIPSLEETKEKSNPRLK